MSERNLRGYIISGLKKAGAFVHAVENPVRPGTPDVYGCYRGVMFWIELKWVVDWPKNGGMLKLKHFTREQRLWLRQNVAAGGRAFVLLQVYDEWMLFHGEDAPEVIGHTDQFGLYSYEIFFAKSSVDFSELLERLVS